MTWALLGFNMGGADKERVVYMSASTATRRRDQPQGLHRDCSRMAR